MRVVTSAPIRSQSSALSRHARFGDVARRRRCSRRTPACRRSGRRVRPTVVAGRPIAPPLNATTPPNREALPDRELRRRGTRPARSRAARCRSRGSPAASTCDDERLQHGQRGRQARLVLRDVGHEAVRIPGAIRGGGRQVRRRSAAPMRGTRSRMFSGPAPRPWTMITTTGACPSGLPRRQRPAGRRAGR